MEVENLKTNPPAPLYDDIFPALPTVDIPKKKVSKDFISFQSPSVTESVEIPLESRSQQAFRLGNNTQTQQSKICSHIASETGVKFHLTNSKNSSLIVTMTGSASQVAQAKTLVLQGLQQHVSRTIKIPCEYHRFLIGRYGDRKRELEANTLTKINIPPTGKNLNEIVISGPNNYLDQAEKEILKLVEFYSQQAFERLKIPKIYHPFIFGPNGSMINDLKNKYDVKITIPPQHVSIDEITVSGKRNEVPLAVKEIMEIYKLRSARCTTIPAVIERDKHRMVRGIKGSGIQEILEQTGVSVESPTDPETSNEFILRGYPEDLGRALTMVYQRISCSSTEEIIAPQRLHKLLIGRKGATLDSIREGYESVRIDFKNNSDKIVLEGPPEEVAIIKERLKAKIDLLKSSFYLASIDVDLKFHNKLLGPQGLIMHFIRANRYDVRLPLSADTGKPANESTIFLEGNETHVEFVRNEIERLIKKMENEKLKDIIVEPRLQKLLRSGNPSPIRQLELAFPEVGIIWPDTTMQRNKHADGAANSTTSYIVQLCGVRDQVDTMAEQFKKLIKQTKDSNYEKETRIFKDCLKRILGAPIIRLLEDTNTKIHYLTQSENGSQPIILTGRQENVEAAVLRLENLQKTLANIEEITVTLPSLFVSKYNDNPGARLRSIHEQCEGVLLKSSRSQPRQLTISGPPDALKLAKNLIDSMCEKMMERCADVIVRADPRIHGQLIGRQGVNLKRFREKHNVEILFPDRNESDPTHASEIHIIGEKEETAKAQVEFEKMAKDMEDEIEASVVVDSALIKELLVHRNSFHYPEFERVKVFWPRSVGGASPTTTNGKTNETASAKDDTHSETVIKIFGLKAHVNAAQQRLESMIENIKLQVTIKYPVTEQAQCAVLNKYRLTLQEMQRSSSVRINFQLFPQIKAEVDGLEKEVFGYIILQGRPEDIENVYNNELLPLLPISEKIDFPQEFHGKLFQTIEQSSQSGKQKLPTPGTANQRSKTAESANNLNEGPKSKLSELQAKYNVTIQVPFRNQRDCDYITVRGVPDYMESLKKELFELQIKYKAEKADWIAQSYEEIIQVEERFANCIMKEKDRIYKSLGVIIYQRGVTAKPNKVSSSNEAELVDENEEIHEDNELSLKPQNKINTSNASIGSTSSLYRLLRSNSINLILQGYQEKVKLARAEIDTIIKACSNFICEELHIPSMVHALLIGARRYNIRRLEESFSVEVEFPPRGSTCDAADIVLVMGTPVNVDLACDDLINRANDLVARFSETPNTKVVNSTASSRDVGADKNHNFAVTGAPWENGTS